MSERPGSVTTYESVDARLERERLEPGESAHAVAEYLADMIGQLEGMAKAGGFDLLVYLLAMARIEAKARALPPEKR